MAASHPKHPATVHFPLTFTTLTGVLDMFHAAINNPTTGPLILAGLKSFDVKVLTGEIARLSYYSTVVTLLTAIPTVATGAWEVMPLIKRDGFSTRKAQTAGAHALLNYLVLFGAMYNWWTRRGAAGFEPSAMNLAISILFALPATLFSAYLGGSLVYNYGMGMRMGSSKGKKTN